MNKFKIKITYQSFDGVKAKIVYLSYWGELSYVLSSNNIIESEIVKIEKILDASEENIIDTTK